MMLTASSYLGDTLVHLSFGLLNMSNSFNPIVLIGPLANYLFLRYVSGDKQTEASQEDRYPRDDPKKFTQLQQWRDENNSFWPSLHDLTKPWALAVGACGLIGVFVEETVRTSFEML